MHTVGQPRDSSSVATTVGGLIATSTIQPRLITVIRHLKRTVQRKPPEQLQVRVTNVMQAVDFYSSVIFAISPTVPTTTVHPTIPAPSSQLHPLRSMKHKRIHRLRQLRKVPRILRHDEHSSSSQQRSWPQSRVCFNWHLPMKRPPFPIRSRRVLRKNNFSATAASHWRLKLRVQPATRPLA